MGFKRVKLSEVVSHVNDFITIDDSTEYKRCRVKLHRQGIVLRDIVNGHEIKTKKQQVCKAGQLLVAEIDAKLGGYGVVPKDLEGAIVSSHYYLFDVNEEKIKLEYLQFCLKTDDFFEQIKPQGSTNYASIRPRDVLNITIPLPTMSEQELIVEKLTGFFKILERLEQVIEENRDLIIKLRNSILQEAIQGKLVKQDPNDEPAAELLKKIREEKERLIKEKKIKKEKPLPPISPEEIPYELPKGWEWVRLGEIGSWGAGATPNRNNPLFYNGSIPWLKTGELNDAFIFDSEEKITELALEKNSIRLNKPGDVLIAMYGATIGKLGILGIEAATNQACCACTPFSGIYNKYLFYYLMSRREYFQNQGAGGAQPNISKEKIINTLMPLPPTNEQKRIVDKIERLFSICEELERCISTSKHESDLLVQSVLRETFQQEILI